MNIQTSDASLVGGTIQMKAKIAPNDWVSIGSAHTITDANISAGSATISIASRPIENDITGFADDADIKIKCTVTDVAGNHTIGQCFFPSGRYCKTNHKHCYINNKCRPI